MSNFLKNLHPLLRRKKNPKDNEDVNYALIKVLNEEMNLIEQDAIESKLQSSLKSSTGTYLDNFGDWFGVYRKKDEDDEKYRARIIKYLLLKRGTNNAIIEAIKDYLEDSNADVSIYEPFRNIFYTNKSHLNGQDHLMGYYYNFAIINVSIGSYFPVEVVDVINEFKPAGVKFYVTYDGGGTNTGNSVIKVLDEPVNIDVYQNIDRLSGYSETFYGHINMGHRKVSYDSNTDIFRTNNSNINSTDVLTGSSSIGRAFHNYAYKTNFIYNPTRTSTVSEIQKVLDEKGRELPLEYYINTTEKNRASVYIDIESTTGTSFIYNNLNLREYFNQYKPELLHGDTQDIKNAISSYVGVATFDLFMEALISPNDVVSTQTQVFDFSIGKWVTINSSEITYGMKNVGAELGYIKDYMNNELNMFTRVVIASSSDITVNINYLDLLFYHYTADVYTVKPYKGLIEYYIELDRLSYVDASKVPSLSNGDVISKTGYEPMGYVRVVGDSNENKDIKRISKVPKTGEKREMLPLLIKEEDLIDAKHTKYLVEFDIDNYGDITNPEGIHLYAVGAKEGLQSQDPEFYKYGNKITHNSGHVRAIVEVKNTLDIKQYGKLYFTMTSFSYNESSDRGKTSSPDRYDLSFSNIVIQDIYEDTDRAPDPSTKTNHAFTDTRVIDATPSRGNSAQDGNILNNEAYSLKSPAVYDNSRYDILTNLTLRKPIESGKTYTIQVKGELGSDRNSFYLYNSTGTFNELYGTGSIYRSDYNPETGIYTKTFVAPPEDYDSYGVNLLPKSTQDNLDPKLAYSSGIAEIDGKKAVVFDNSNNIAYLKGVEYSLKDGEVYTFSFYAKATKEIGMTQGVYINGQNRGFIKDTIFTTEWTRYSFTFTADENNKVGIHMYPIIKNDDGTYEKFYVTDWQLERGDKLTEVKPAPSTPPPDRKRLNEDLILYQAPKTGTSKSTIEWVKIEEGAQATPAGYNYGYYTLAENLPKGNYDIYYKAKIEVLEGNPDMLTIVDYPGDKSTTDPKFLVPIDNGYVKGKLSVNRTDDTGRVLLYAGLAGSTAGNKIRFSELEVYYSTDIPDYVQNEIILRNSSGEVLETTKVDSEYTTTNSVYNGLRTYNHTVMLYGSYTNISEIEVRGTGELTNAKLQYTRYNNPSSWNTLEEIKKLTPTEEPFSLKYENKLRDLYGLQLIDYSELNAMSTVKLKSIWETTIGEITDTEGSFTDMSSGYFNAVWQYIDRLDTVSLNSLKVLDDIAGGMIDNSIQTVTVRRKPTISQYTEVTDYREVRPIYTESLIMNSPRRLYELADVTMVDETINIDRRIKVIDSHTEQEPNTNILIDSYKTREIVGSGFADYNLKEPIEQGETYNVKITGNFKSGLERIAVGNSSGSFNEVFIYPEDIKNGVINKTYTARLGQYAEGKQRLNKDYRLYIQPYTSDSSIIYSVELRKL